MTPQEAYMTASNMKPFARVPELEQVIIQSADYAHRYAFHFLKGPWPEAETIMQTDLLVWDYYQKDILHKLTIHVW